MNNVYNAGELHLPWGRIAKITIICIVLLIIIVFAIAFLITGRATNADYINMSGDIIPSMKNVVGVRKISSVSVNVQDGVEKKEYAYGGIENVSKDILEYINYLNANENFITTQDYDLTKPTGSLQIGKKSQEVGKIILLSIEYSLGSYTIKIEKGVGELYSR